ncbi:hypothetical protein C4561_02315 [candidate division WWE3 bacterium]|uniref:Uncharacterized protein n=1 Tax=candidate division WWE3 bacterium TaxID=2053526 RepID=A0A3A4ZDR9_UNCKA|nr:MAG: hypothetical protein C4561_02315 [candidate division WWE3 bacterium]
MKKIITLLLLLGIPISIYLVATVTKNKNSDNHLVQFNPVACFSCYGCNCEYTVDRKTTYKLNEFDKTKCLDFQGDIGAESASVSLDSKEFDEFLKCVKQYDGIPSPTEN